MANTIINLYKELRSLQPAAFDRGEYRTVKNILRLNTTTSHTPAEAVAQITRSLETAIIVSREIGMNAEGIKACLLSTYITNAKQLDNIKQQLGDKVSTILEGIINIQQLYQKNTSIESENFRNLLISFAKDMRVILIMIADCTNT
ncbi:MAG: HD domain-containing protein, partial [Bacteroidaceae bacterium]